MLVFNAAFGIISEETTTISLAKYKRKHQQSIAYSCELRLFSEYSISVICLICVFSSAHDSLPSNQRI